MTLMHLARSLFGLVFIATIALSGNAMAVAQDAVNLKPIFAVAIEKDVAYLPADR